MQAFELSQPTEQRSKAQELYLEFLRVRDVSVGVYELPAGGTDPQLPHTEDAGYCVVRGAAKITVGAEERAVQAGSVVYVEKNVEHRFHSIDEALTVLVFFAPAEYTNKGAGAGPTVSAKADEGRGPSD